MFYFIRILLYVLINIEEVSIILILIAAILNIFKVCLNLLLVITAACLIIFVG